MLKCSAQSLSVARSNLAATSVGTKHSLLAALQPPSYSAVVDIYDGSSGLWSNATLSVARSSLAATSVGTQALFAGGLVAGQAYGQASAVVDIYDGSSGLWSTAALSVAGTTWPPPVWARRRCSLADMAHQILLLSISTTAAVVVEYCYSERGSGPPGRYQWGTHGTSSLIHGVKMFILWYSDLSSSH